MQLMYLGSLTLPGSTGGAYNTDRICIPEKKSHKSSAVAKMGDRLAIIDMEKI